MKRKNEEPFFFELVTERPSWGKRLYDSEPIVYFIMLVGLAGLLLGLYQTAYLLAERARVQRQLGNVNTPSNDSRV